MFNKMNYFRCLLALLFMHVCVQLQAQTVHILMPVFNSEQYLQKALESVFNQTYEDVCIIAYNDGSTDLSPKILENYKNRFEKKLVLLQTPTNRGISNARQSLLKCSQELDSDAMVLWLDSDDCYIDTEFIEKFVRLMQKTGAEICLFNFELVFENESQIGNANGLFAEQKASEQILDLIQKIPTQTVSPGDLIHIMGFTSLGWTKGYHHIKFPQPAQCPYEDFVYMAALLNASTITAFPAEYKPIRYLRRSNSITGKRSAATFDAVLTQLETFITQVNPDKKMLYHAMVKGFLERKVEQYETLLKRLISEQQHSDLSQETLEAYQKKASQLLQDCEN